MRSDNTFSTPLGKASVSTVVQEFISSHITTTTYMDCVACSLRGAKAVTMICVTMICVSEIHVYGRQPMVRNAWPVQAEANVVYKPEAGGRLWRLQYEQMNIIAGVRFHVNF